MKIVTISDTHDLQLGMGELPDGDVLVHAGDLSNVGEENDVKRGIEWIKDQPHKYKVFIAGNHDRSFDPKFNGGFKKPGWLSVELMNIPANMFYLEDSQVTIEGIKFYGTPWTPWFYGLHWAFNAHRGSDIYKKWSNIPADTNVLISHGPVQGILDLCEGGNVGCGDLKTVIPTLTQLKAHISGHIHEGYGFHEENGIKYANASICNYNYRPINKPIIIEL